MPSSGAVLRTYGKRKHADAQGPSKRRRMSESPVKTDEEDELPAKPAVVRDFSDIFDAIPSPAATPSSPKKRMLGRSKTESSVESPSQSGKESWADRTPSLPNMPPSPSKSFTSLTSTPTAKAKASTTRTYAGKFRSFLVAVPSSSGDAQAEGDEFRTRESYNSLRSRWGVDTSDDDPIVLPSPTKSTKSTSTVTSDASPSRKGKKKEVGRQPTIAQNGMMNPLRSISELRNRGESRRFLDEVGYLFEGLDGKVGIGLRRASALEITTKLCVAEFTRKAKGADFFSRTWDLFLEAGAGNGEDKILDVLLVFFLALVARDESSLSELALHQPTSSNLHPNPNAAAASNPNPNPNPKEDEDEAEGSTLVNTLLSILQRTSPETDLVVLGSKPGIMDGEMRKAGLGRKERTLLTSIHTVLTKSQLFAPGTLLSTPLLITRTLHALPSSFITPRHMPTILESLRGVLGSFSSASGAQPLSEARSGPYECVWYHLRLVDAYLVGQGGGDGRQAYEEDPMEGARGWMVKGLAGVCLCAELLVRRRDLLDALDDGGEDDDGGGDDEEQETVYAMKSQQTALRILVSLTHADEGWARAVLGSERGIRFLMRCVWGGGGDQATSLAQGRGLIKEEEEDGDGDGDTEDGEREREREAQALDTLCLALGLLTNLVQSVDEAKDVVRDIRLNPTCTLRSLACAERCGCGTERERMGGLEVLVGLYARLQGQLLAGASGASGVKHEPQVNHEDQAAQAQAQADAEKEAETAFLLGHLAVLFGLLMRRSEENRGVVLGALPAPWGSNDLEDVKPSKLSNDTKPSTTSKSARSRSDPKSRRLNPNEANENRAKLARLVEQARAFLIFYTVVSRRMGAGGASGSARFGAWGADDEDTEDERDGEDEQEGVGGNLKESRVAQEVVEFLEGLRDRC